MLILSLYGLIIRRYYSTSYSDRVGLTWFVHVCWFDVVRARVCWFDVVRARVNWIVNSVFAFASLVTSSHTAVMSSSLEPGFFL